MPSSASDKSVNDEQEREDDDNEEVEERRSIIFISEKSILVDEGDRMSFF